MSKVVIQGNANGTGNFTIAAPNSNTDRTFNLPDAAGTVLTTGNQSDFPAGSVLQVATDTLEGIISGSYTTGAPSTITNGTEVFSLSFTPTSASSTILVMTSTVCMYEDANLGDVWWLALWDGSTFVAANSATWAYTSFANSRNGIYHSLCHTYDAGSTSTRTISVRGGLNGGTGVHQYINGNSYLSYTGSSARIQMTVMEIAG
jgi:hypothetical protein